MSCPTGKSKGMCQASGGTGVAATRRLPSTAEVRARASRYEPLSERDIEALRASKQGRTTAVELAKGGYRFSIEQIIRLGNPAGERGMTVAHWMAVHGFPFRPADLLYQLGGDPGDEFGVTISHRMAETRLHRWTLADMITLGNPADQMGRTLAHRVAKYQDFTVDDLLRLENPADEQGKTVAHVLAERGVCFSIPDLKRLGNPSDCWGCTVAHWMLQAGHCFSVDEISDLGNPANNRGETLAHGQARSFPQSLSLADLLRLGNPPDQRGITPAHRMAESGRAFTAREILMLGDPKTDNGLGIADYMEQAGQHLSDEQQSCLRSGDWERWEVERSLESGQAPPFEILIRRPDLSAEYGI